MGKFCPNWVLEQLPCYIFTNTDSRNPTTNIDDLEWEIYNTSTRIYLEIGETLELKKGLNEDRYAFWDTLFPIKNNL